MIILWKSADKTAELSLVDGSNQWDYEWLADRTLARDMLAFLRDHLARHGATFDDISGVGVFRGPGSFTGLRIGMTVLNTLAIDRKVPIVGATGDDWRLACEERLSRGDNDRIVLPEYGTPARVTQPRK